MYLKVILLVACVAYAEAKMCPNIKPAENYNLTAFASGVWSDLARYPNPLETAENCLSLTYTYDGNIVEIDNVEPVDGPNFITGAGRPQPDGSIYFTGLIGSPKKEFEVAMTIVKVQYDKFAIKYSCVENGDDIIEFVWIVSRSTNLTDADKDELYNFINSYDHIDMDRLYWIKFSDELCNTEKK